MRRAFAAAVIALALGIGGCASSGDEDERVTVLAAASLTGTFTELAEQFEREHDGVDVVLSFGGSSDLAAQIVEGAPADVFAAADERTMGTVVDAGAAEGTPVAFATNTLQIVVPKGNPARVASLADVARPGTRTVLCAPQVPCGAASAALLGKAGVEVSPVSEEQSVTDVLGKVRSGEADAGLVYVTDVRGAGDDVGGVEVPEAAGVVNHYPIVALGEAADSGLADEFVAFVRGPQGRSVLADAGFGAP